MGLHIITDISVFFIYAYTYNSQLVNFNRFDFVKNIYLLIHLCIYSFIDLFNHLFIDFKHLFIYLIIYLYNHLFI